MAKKAYHSVCAWTFNAGKGGFTPPDARPGWDGNKLDSVGKIKIIKEKIAPRMPDHIALGYEMHYDYEYNEKDSAAIADALVSSGVSLAMTTPGAHRHFAYGGICSMDPAERAKANEYGQKAIDLTYGPLAKAWNKDVIPAFIIWNGSFGYDLATLAIQKMYGYLKENVAGLCKYEAKKGGKLFFAIEPKPNEGHPAMLLPTVASGIVFWKKLAEEYGIDISNKGINKEFGHSEMIGLDHVYDTVEEIDNKSLIHMHVNSQGYNDGILLGGPGKYDIDNGARINGMNIAIAGLIKNSGFDRWKGHDMQVRAHDTEEQGIDRIIRSVLSWDACEQAAAQLDEKALIGFLEKRETAKAEDVMRHSVMVAQQYFDKVYKG
jgi:xylose isomerase